ncbi:asr4858 [Nostoc sp. PCC 7120 = FACHB-418]|nr:asr4858 [Nostoc sp. PCC 7120 = FACHB-418]
MIRYKYCGDEVLLERSIFWRCLKFLTHKSMKNLVIGNWTITHSQSEGLADKKISTM